MVRTLCEGVPEAWVGSLFRELRSRLPHSVAKKKVAKKRTASIRCLGDDLMERLRRARSGKISVVSGDDGKEAAELAWNLLKCGRQEPEGMGGAVLRRRGIEPRGRIFGCT